MSAHTERNPASAAASTQAPQTATQAGSRGASAPDLASSPKSDRTRLALLGLILLAFAHVTVGLAYKDLWWDESLSLQRAEQSLWNLLRGLLVIKDGFTEVPTIDQHPFFYFLIQAGLIRVAGTSEFVLRFASAAAATLMTLALWVWGRWAVRRKLAPPVAPWLAAILAATSPFLLWYGQEARPYALWALLAALSTYLLSTAVEPRHDVGWRRVGYVVTLLCFLVTHYYAVFLLPVHALIIMARYWRTNRRITLVTTLLFALVSVAIIGFAFWNVVRQAGGGNFPTITLGSLLPDLLNAYTLGLSVNIDQVRWLDALFALLALLGALWMLRSRAARAGGGWILPLCVVVPVGVLLVGNVFQNLYMNARHMSLIAGPLLLLIATGAGLLWTRWRWLGAAVMVVLLAGFAFSTVNYYTREEYAKDDFTRFGAYLDGRLMPGDAILYYPPSSWRIFEYYAPMAAVQEAIDNGADLSIHGIPLLSESGANYEDTYAFLTQLGAQARRIWVLKSGTHPYYDVGGVVETWLVENFTQVRNAQFFSQSSLRAQLYLPRIPVLEGAQDSLPNASHLVFGDNIRVSGFVVEPDAYASLPTPVTLYWQVDRKPERRYKYILELLRQNGDQLETLGTIEREPYEGDIPTTFWDPERTIVEYVELEHLPVDSANDRLYLALQLYDAETLDKLPVSNAAGLEVDTDGYRVLLPIHDFPQRGAP